MGWSQIFLKITFDGGGLVKGESELVGYEDQIVLTDFDWSMSAGKDVVKNGKAVARRLNMESLTLSKRFDIASTELLSALRKRDRIKTARITVAQSYAVSAVAASLGLRDAFAIEIQDGYLEDISLNMVADGKAMVLQEELSIRYSKIKVEVTPVNRDGTYSKVKSIFTADVRDSMDLK